MDDVKKLELAVQLAAAQVQANAINSNEKLSSGLISTDEMVNLVTTYFNKLEIPTSKN